MILGAQVPAQSTEHDQHGRQVEAGATHTESAWARRLPRALPFLARAWWAPLAAANAADLYFTSPRRLTAGQA